MDLSRRLGGSDGDLSTLIDYRQVGSISQKEVQDKLAAWIFSKINAANKDFRIIPILCRWFR